MRKFISLIIFTFFILTFVSFASADSSFPYIRYWIICGPFEKADLDTECIENEAGLSLIAGKMINGKRARKYLSPQDKITFYLEEVYGPHDDSVVYAFTEVYSPDEKEVRLYLGSDDGIKVWLNGENIFTAHEERYFVYDENKIDVKLKSGWNNLLLKVNNKEGIWEFSARFVSKGSTIISDLNYIPPFMIQIPVQAVEVSSVERNDKEAYSGKNAVDKDLSTRWSSEPSDPQWIIIDLGYQESIKKILLNWEEAYAKNYSIEFSTNKINWTRIYSTDIGAGGQEVINADSMKTRYIKLTGNRRGTRFGYSLWEFQAFK